VGHPQLRDEREKAGRRARHRVGDEKLVLEGPSESGREHGVVVSDGGLGERLRLLAAAAAFVGDLAAVLGDPSHPPVRSAG
jgi:hypothetical protein